MSRFRHCPACAALLAAQPDAEGRARLTCPACGFVHYDNPLPVVAALVEHEGAIILAKNRGWRGNWFGLITGFLEKGEEPEAAVLREVQEELGLEGEIVSWIGLYGFSALNQVILAWHVRARGTVVLGDELEAIKRIDPDKLRPWALGTGRAVADWLARRG